MWQLDLTGHWNVAVLAFGLVCVAGCMQESVWRGIMRSLDNFFKGASEITVDVREPGRRSWPGQEEGRGVGSFAQHRALWGFPVLWNLRREACEIQSELEPPTLPGSCILTPWRHCILINPPKLFKRGKKKKKKRVHVTKWEGTRGGCGGDKEWFGCRPSQSAADSRFTQAGRWSLQLALCCCQRNKHVRLSLPASSWIRLHANSDARLMPVCVFFSPYLHGKKL